MNWDTFLNDLKERLSMPLPGMKVQLNMSPLGRLTRFTRYLKIKNVKNSGVLILLFPKDNSLFFILTQRPKYEGTHSGQVCLPGGKQEKFDLDLYNTATRETREEINAEESKIVKIGKLTELFVPPSSFIIQPFVGYTPVQPDFKIQPDEVQEIILVDLFAFVKNPVIKREKIPDMRNFNIIAPYYDINGFVVWGATAMILSEFFFIVNDVIDYMHKSSLKVKAF